MTESATQPRRHLLTAEHFEPWRDTFVDLTLSDGSHRVGLLKQIAKGDVHLRAARGNTPLPDGGVIRIVDTVEIRRGAVN